MASMVPRKGDRDFLKWLNGQGIVGSASEPRRFGPGPAHVAILRAARYVNAPRDARGRANSCNDRDEPFERPRALAAPPYRALARPCGHGTGVRRAGQLYRRAVPEGLYPAAQRAGT